MSSANPQLPSSLKIGLKGSAFLFDEFSAVPSGVDVSRDQSLVYDAPK
jgi:hypothetical protein